MYRERRWEKTSLLSYERGKKQIINLKANAVIYKEGEEDNEDFLFTESEAEDALKIIEMMNGKSVSSAIGLPEKVKKILLKQVISV